MSNRILVGTALLLTLGSAVAGTFLYGQVPPAVTAMEGAPLIEHAPVEVLSEETMQAWKANAVASTYILPKLPI